MEKMENLKDMVRFYFGAGAFAFGYQWTYDITENLEQFSKTNLELINPLAKKFHPNRTAGDFGSYEDQGLALLDSLSRNKKFDVIDFKNTWKKLWTEDYNEWIDSATKTTLASGKGSNSNDLSPVSRIAPLFLLKGLTLNEMLKNVSEYIEVTHNNIEVIDYGKFIVNLVHELSSGGDLLQSIEKIKNNYPHCKKYIDAGIEMSQYSWKELMESEVPTYCEIDGSGPLVIYLLLKFWNSPIDMFEYNAIFDGDSNARSGILALVVGLEEGYPEFAKNWYNNLHKKNEIEALLAKF
ncbi:ADP-ribosylglycohydrolase family protein [Cetobacterium sp. 2A]|uniref:ADP-ribosylglycohydrolase family protein n=1 Tax=unclassified Cetobacterium TaxID=2630983 RepID=UPI00163CE2B1|nr:ADP-ribosylglycohydrolase family protein [Cetobacterium sp. 2A]MBC2855179.1 ADP-ribosylglycohydrolase family protein [Cetobacterium sp. 2A]